MTDMRAAVYRSPDPLTVEQMDINGPEAGEVLVKIDSCGVCHSDLHVMNMMTAAKMQAPMVLGHEAAGVVEEIGDGVTSVAPGDHVVIAFHPTCGRCYYCVRAMPQLCERSDFPDRSARGERPRLTQDGSPIQQGVGVGGFAQYSVMPDFGVIKIRDDAPLAAASLVGCSVTTGVGAAINAAQVEPGSDVAVIGLGGVGLNVVQGARLAGAHRIIAVDLLDHKGEEAMQFGATDFVNGGDDDAIQQVKRIAAGGYLDYAFEAIGLPQTVAQAFDMIRPGGTAVVVGLVTQPVTIPGRDFLQEKKLIGTLYGSSSVHHDIPKLIDLYMDGKLLLDELISRRRPLGEINEAMADMEAGEVARTVIDVNA